MLSHRNTPVQCQPVAPAAQPTPADIIYGVLPMSHIVGFSIILRGR